MEKGKPGSVIYVTCTKSNFKPGNSVYHSTFIFSPLSNSSSTVSSTGNKWQDNNLMKIPGSK